MPTYLLYDFGILYVAYLRGTGASSMFSFELVYDYIAVTVFYTRLLVQSVRIILMIFVYTSLYDLVLFNAYDYNNLFGYEDSLNPVNTKYMLYDLSYTLLTQVIAQTVYLIYELLHMFFVMTAQTIAFFAMVFWLFIFLYTFFMTDKIESFFNSKRESYAIKHKRNSAIK
jgi:hypothetical protein